MECSWAIHCLLGYPVGSISHGKKHKNSLSLYEGLSSEGMCSENWPYVCISPATPQHNLFENLVQLKYLEMTLTNENFMKQNIKDS
jgi:hypothetical protein